MLALASRNLCQSQLKLGINSCLSHWKLCLNYSNDLSTAPKKLYLNRMEKYLVFRSNDHVKSYIEVIEKYFPKFINVYRTFRVGTQKLYCDLKSYVLIQKKMKIDGIDSLSRENLQLSFTFPRDFFKISPVLLMSAIPFTNYIIFPLAIYFPHFILTSHYWSIEDKFHYILKNHQKSLKHNKLLLNYIQYQVDEVEDSLAQTKLKAVIHHVGNGRHPLISDIIQCKTLFSGFPYSLKHIKQKHCVSNNIFNIYTELVELMYLMELVEKYII